MELLTITLAANETKQFAKAGRYLEITDSSYAVRVDFTGDQGQQTDSMVNALSGLFIEDPFAAFAITNGATAQSVTFLILEMGRGGSRRQPGNVRVIDQNSDKTLAGTQFACGFSYTPPSTRAAWVGLAAGTKRIAIKRLFISASTAGLVSLQYATSVSGTGYTANRYTIGSKLFGSADSSANIFTATDQSAIAGARLFSDVLVVANQSIEVPLTTPIVLPVGTALTVQGVQGDRIAQAFFDFEEL